MTDTVTVTIDNKEISVPQEITILEAAQRLNIDLPTLCYHPDLRNTGNCRMCVVEVEGMPTFQPACAMNVWDGMNITTFSPELRKARKMTLELIMSRHDTDCLNCNANNNCELQDLAERLHVDDVRFDVEPDYDHPIDNSSIVKRDPTKCVNCGRCIRMCNDIQQANALDWAGRGYEKMAMPTFEMELADTTCINCGQCINVCPVGALNEQDDIEKAWSYIEDPDIHTVVQTAPAIRAAIGEACGLNAGYLSSGKMFAAIKSLGFDKAMDTNFTADLTIMEEGTEFLGRLTKALKEKEEGIAFPMITSCSPGWIKFMETFYSDFIPNISSCKSPQQMFGPVAKTYYAEKAGVDPAKMRVISIMPCTAKKYECDRPEMNDSGYKDVDIVLTTREFGRMIKEAGVDFDHLEKVTPDSPLGESSGAADIFANTGGVMEAALRTVYELVTGDPIPTLNFAPVRGLDGVKEAEVTFEKTVPAFDFLQGVTAKVAVAHTTGNARKVLDAVRSGEKSYHFIEIMACPGGCIGGGGQPKPVSWDIKMERAKAIYQEDDGKEIRKSHENPSITKIYEDFLEKANSHKAHELLHTHYTNRSHLK